MAKRKLGSGAWLPEETTASPGVNETPEGEEPQAAPREWICPHCRSSYNRERHPVAIENHKRYCRG